MAELKCPDCGANMVVISNYDGTSTQHCEYCGKNIHVQAPGIKSQLGFILSRAVNSVVTQLDPYVQQESHLEELKRLRDMSDGKARAKLDKQIALEERRLEAYRLARRR